MKGLKEIFKGFSIKKLLLSILCSIIVTTFIGFTIIFITEIPSYTFSEYLMQMDNNSEPVKEYGNYMQETYKQYEKIFKEEKEMYGEDYPSEGIFLGQLTNSIKSSQICEVYMSTLLIGTIIGTLIYIIFIQKTKGIQMLVETIICGIAIILIIMLINWGYNSIINKIGIDNTGYTAYVYDIDESTILYGFLGIIGISYIINLIYQAILTKKLNKKLNKR